MKKIKIKKIQIIRLKLNIETKKLNDTIYLELI
mgnify:CR=1 FL=1